MSVGGIPTGVLARVAGTPAATPGVGMETWNVSANETGNLPSKGSPLTSPVYTPGNGGAGSGGLLVALCALRAGNSLGAASKVWNGVTPLVQEANNFSGNSGVGIFSAALGNGPYPQARAAVSFTGAGTDRGMITLLTALNAAQLAADATASSGGKLTRAAGDDIAIAITPTVNAPGGKVYVVVAQVSGASGAAPVAKTGVKELVSGTSTIGAEIYWMVGGHDIGPAEGGTQITMTVKASNAGDYMWAAAAYRRA